MKNFLAFLTLSVGALSASPEFFELPPIKYSETASDDEIARWEKEIEAQGWESKSGGGKEFLRAVLERLDIPVESQVMVFSKTSLQNDLISQRNPRCIYFSDSAYVGWVPGGKVEVIVEDAKLGPVFYVLEPPLGSKKPEFIRATDSCLQCHANSRTEGVPGMFIRSVIPDENSHPILSRGTTLVDHATPIPERWGGWYVSGESDEPHLGNQWTTEEVGMEPKRQDLEDLNSLIDTEKYLAPTSDVVALMVLEHQCQVHNLLTKAKFNFQRALWFQNSIEKGIPLDDPDSMAWKSANQLANEIVDAILFKDEVEIGGDGVDGSEAFAKVFTKRGVLSSSGKNLRKLKLYGRLFKYRCSYMVYSKAFRNLPDPVKQRVFVRLREALSDDGISKYRYIGKRERGVIRQILDVTGFSTQS